MRPSKTEGVANLLIIPYEGLRPAIPQYEAGRRVEPPVSVDSALKDVQPSDLAFEHLIGDSAHTSHMEAATAAALPPELPPAERRSRSRQGI